MTPIQIIICDDDVFIRESLKLILNLQADMQVVGTCNNGYEAAQMISEIEADILLMDMRMPECDGVQGTLLVRERNPSVRVLILTTFDDEQYIVDALRNGASGYLLKNSSPDRLTEAVRTVHTGSVLMDPAVARKLAALLQTPAPEAVSPSKQEISIPWEQWMLSPSEQGIIHQIAEGKTNKEIASVLFLSEGTIKNYVTDILSKLELRDRTQLAIWYWKQRALP